MVFSPDPSNSIILTTLLIQITIIFEEKDEYKYEYLRNDQYGTNNLVYFFILFIFYLILPFILKYNFLLTFIFFLVNYLINFQIITRFFL